MLNLFHPTQMSGRKVFVTTSDQQNVFSENTQESLDQAAVMRY